MPNDAIVPRKASQIHAVPIMSLRASESPRLNGEDKAHAARLAEADTRLPPILVHRRTMRVIDGMHRLMAASLQGRDTVEVEYFDGSDEDVFLLAVQENVTHGLPLTHADRRAAAERIIASHPRMSDRAIGHAAGLAARTVAAIRKQSVQVPTKSASRVGRDGRVRPLDSSDARRHAAELLTGRPESSLRDIARAAGISPATVLDVRKRIERGESPVPERLINRSVKGRSKTANSPGEEGGPAPGLHVLPPLPPPRFASPPNLAATVEKLVRDPSLRESEWGKSMLRLFHANAVSAAQLPNIIGHVPPHCLGIVVQLARYYAWMWHEFAKGLDSRARIVDPTASSH